MNKKIEQCRAANAVTNKEFLSALFNDLSAEERCWVTAFSNPPLPERATGTDWAGRAQLPGEVRELSAVNGYFSVAAFLPNRDGRIHRNTPSFSRMVCVVLDDASGCDLAPTWKLETSAGKYQIGYRLSEPLSDADTAKRLNAALANQKAVAVDKSGNNHVRYVRLPVGSNTKTEPAFECQLRVWNPELRVSLEELCSALGVELDYVLKGLTAVGNLEEGEYDYGGEATTEEDFKAEVVRLGHPLREGRRELFKSFIGGEAARGAPLWEIMGKVQSLIEDYCDPKQPSRLENYRAIAEFCVKRERERAAAVNDLPLIKNAVARAEALIAAGSGSVAAQALKGEPEGTNQVHPYNRYDADIEAENEPIEYLLDGLIQKGVVLLAGSTGAGKTTQLVPLMMRVAHLCRLDDPLRPLLQRKVIYISEDKRQVKRIIASMRLKGELGLHDKATANARFKLVEAARITPGSIVAAVEDYKNFYTRNLNEKNGVVYDAAPLVVFDTANASFNLENENDNAEVGKAMALLKQRFSDIPIIIVGHLAKTLKRADIIDLSARGAGAWEADANQVLYLTREDDNSRWLEIKNAKHRFVERGEGILFGCEWTGRKVLDPLGNETWETVLHGVPRLVEDGGREELKEQKKEQAEAVDALSTGLMMTDARKKAVRMLEDLGEGGYKTKNELCDWLRENSSYLKTKATQLRAIEQWIKYGYILYTKDIKKRHMQHQAGCVINRSER
jgi:AAA domain